MQHFDDYNKYRIYILNPIAVKTGTYFKSVKFEARLPHSKSAEI